VRIIFVLALLAPLSACVGPPPSHALVVRHPELKCALIAFSGCSAFVPNDEADEEGDAGVD